MTMVDIHVQFFANPSADSWRHALGIWLHRLAAHIDGRAYLRIDIGCTGAPLPPLEDITKAMEIGHRRTCELIATAARLQMIERVAARTNPQLWEGCP